jgi:deoxyribose-phosphate aldolase
MNLLTKVEAARLVDISAVRTINTLEDIRENVEYAKKYKFINVHVLPCWVKTLSEMLENVEGVYVGAPVGFPSGAHTTKTKISEAEQLINDGVEEMDIVMNVGKFKNKEYDYVLNELKNIIELSDDKILTKVIIEINCLTDYEIAKACEIVLESGADFLKTGTGWILGDANIKRIKYIKELVKNDVKIKAAGGIRIKEEFLTLYNMGIERFGINTKSAIEIINSF